MKLYLLISVLLTLIIGNQCGLIEGFYNTVRNTTNTIKNDIGGAFQYGKHFVFGENKPDNANETQDKGVFNGMTRRIHDVSENVKNQISRIFSVPNGNENRGILGKLTDRFKYFVISGKKFIFGDKIQTIDSTETNFHNKTSVFRETVKKYLFSNKTRQDFGLSKTIANLIEAMDEMRCNWTKKIKEGERPNMDGTGLIDPRGLRVNADFDKNIANGIEGEGEKMKNLFAKVQQKAKNTIDSTKQSTNDFIEKHKSEVKIVYDSVNND